LSVSGGEWTLDRDYGINDRNIQHLRYQKSSSLSSKNSDIIRMEPEDIEKTGGCGVDERSSRDGDPGRKSGNLEKRGRGKSMEEQAKPHAHYRHVAAPGTGWNFSYQEE